MRITPRIYFMEINLYSFIRFLLTYLFTLFCIKASTIAPATLPCQGELSFKDVTLRYRSDLGLVLRDFNLQIPSGAKVAIVGRTGAGKTSLFSALQRLYDYTGSITMDGVDISSEIGMRIG